MKFEAFGDKVIVRRVEAALEQKTDGGLFLPQSAQKRGQQALVLSVGPGERLASINGLESNRPDLKAGDVVLIPEYAGQEFKVDGETLVVLSVRDVQAVQRAEKAPEVQN